VNEYKNKMAGFWSKFPDETLDPLNLAEKKWAIAAEECQKLVARESQNMQSLAMIASTTQDHQQRRECNEKMRAAGEAIERARDHVQRLHYEWVNLKPDVSKGLKEALRKQLPVNIIYT
jgi:hypothetical protein